MPNKIVEAANGMIRDFAANIGIRFRTPEEFFLQEEPRPFAREFDPSAFLQEAEALGKPVSASTFRDSQPHDILFTTPFLILSTRPQYFLENEPSRDCPTLWQSRSWKVFLLLEASTTSWLRPGESRHS